MGRRKPETFLKAAVLGTIGIIVPEMPLAEHPRAIAARPEPVGHSLQISPQECAATADVDGAIARRIETCQQLSARRRAHGSRVKVRQPDTLLVQSVQLRSPGNGVSVATQVAIALVVRHDDDYVGSRTIHELLQSLLYCASSILRTFSFNGSFPLSRISSRNPFVHSGSSVFLTIPSLNA